MKRKKKKRKGTNKRLKILHNTRPNSDTNTKRKSRPTYYIVLFATTTTTTTKLLLPLEMLSLPVYDFYRPM